MTSFRRLLMDHRTLSTWLIACALLMKMLVPVGFMPVASAGMITIELCSGYGPERMAPEKMVIAMPGMEHHQDKPDHRGREIPCAFSGLSVPSLAAVDPLVLAIAIIVLLATVFRIAAVERIVAPAYLRPPLRGPPTRS